jgi:hypothetical protein
MIGDNVSPTLSGESDRNSILRVYDNHGRFTLINYSGIRKYWCRRSFSFEGARLFPQNRKKAQKGAGAERFVCGSKDNGAGTFSWLTGLRANTKVDLMPWYSRASPTYSELRLTPGVRRIRGQARTCTPTSDSAGGNPSGCAARTIF